MFNLVGVVDLIVDYYHAVQVGLPVLAGQLSATYAIQVLLTSGSASRSANRANK